MKCYIMTELAFLKEMVLKKQVRWKSVIFDTAGIFLNKEIKFKPYVCHDLLMNLSDIAILHIKGCDYCCIISGISKREAIKLFENTDLT